MVANPSSLESQSSATMMKHFSPDDGDVALSSPQTVATVISKNARNALLLSSSSILGPPPIRRSSMKSGDSTAAVGGCRNARSRGNNNNENKKKSVSFNETVHCRTTISLEDITDVEKRNSWLQEDEIASIKKRCQWVVSQVEKTGSRQLDDGRILYVRGLENQMREHATRRQHNMVVAREEVFSEQEFQDMCGLCDDERIAAVYANTTSKSRQQAILIASQDRKEVEAILNK